MFAVIKTGGKQYRVAENDVIKVEKLDGVAGDRLVLESVLMLNGQDGPLFGTPHVAGAVVETEILDQIRGAKIIVFKKKRRQNYRRKRGHRQSLTVLRVMTIRGPNAA